MAKDDIFHVVKAIVATQRDYGRRDDRKQSRLKYLVDSWGIDKFRLVVEQYFGKKIQPFRYVAWSVLYAWTLQLCVRTEKLAFHSCCPLKVLPIFDFVTSAMPQYREALLS